MNAIGAGILGIGVYLPETIRRNDWWPDHVVSKWKDKAMHRRADEVPLARTPGVEAALRAMAELHDDPFGGSVERRVMKDDELSSDMEIVAARRALESAKVAASEIDAIISFTFCPDYLSCPTGAVVHQRLGLPKRCMTFSLEAACNSFGIQLSLADQAIRSGSMKRVLLVTSSAYSKVMPMEAPMSPWLGDGATAVVLGPVPAGRGILAYAHGTDSEAHSGMVCGVPGKRWYDEGRIIGYAEDKRMAQAIILRAVDHAKSVTGDALAKAGLTPNDVDFYAGHQGGPWMRRVTQEFSGMHRARSLDTFKAFGNLGAANIPLILSLAAHEGTLRDGDVVATFSAGTGMTYSSVVMRWGRD